MTRRQSAIQRRPRASDRARTTRLGERRVGVDLRLLAIAAFLAVGAVIVVTWVLVAGGNQQPIGQVIPNAGQTHVADGGSCRTAPATCELAGNPYTSLPATSGPHWGTPSSWGVAVVPVPESQAIHNLEHGGIVIWYTDDLDPEAVLDLRSYVEGQMSGGRYKFILSPWTGADFGHPIAITAWTRLLYLDDTADAEMEQLRQFVDRYYQTLGPEPGGGPGPPA